MELMAGAAVGWFKKATAPLNEVARARLWEGDAGGSPSPEGEAELADLLDSFYDGDGGSRSEEQKSRDKRGSAARRNRRQRRFSPGKEVDGGEGGGTWRCKLEAVLAEMRADAAAERVRVAAETAVRMAGAGGAAPGLKSKVSTRLREDGFDAGLCTSSWVKAGEFKSGTHEYVDVMLSGGGGRYIVVLNIAAEFEIARPSGDYPALLRVLPAVFVGRPDALRSVVLLMCGAVKESMTSAGMYLAPWRQSSFVLGKWFNPYKRTPTSSATTTNAVFSIVDGTRRDGTTEGRGPAGGRAMRAGVKRQNKFCRAAFGCKESPQDAGGLATFN